MNSALDHTWELCWADNGRDEIFCLGSISCYPYESSLDYWSVGVANPSLQHAGNLREFVQRPDIDPSPPPLISTDFRVVMWFGPIGYWSTYVSHKESSIAIYVLLTPKATLTLIEHFTSLISFYSSTSFFSSSLMNNYFVSLQFPLTLVLHLPTSSPYKTSRNRSIGPFVSINWSKYLLIISLYWFIAVADLSPAAAMVRIPIPEYRTLPSLVPTSWSPLPYPWYHYCIPGTPTVPPWYPYRTLW